MDMVHNPSKYDNVICEQPLISGDTNELKFDSTLHLDSKLKQCVDQQTRFNPDAMLDPIITDLHKFYQTPVCGSPLEVDDGKTGENSDHMMVLMAPLDSVNNKKIKFCQKFERRRTTRFNHWYSRIFISIK